MTPGETHYQDIFYDVTPLSKKKRITIIQDAYSKCESWNVDMLDMSQGWGRKKIEMSFDEIISKFDSSCHFVIIHRRGFESWKTDDEWNRWKFEIGFSTMKGTSYYLWLFLNESKIPEFVKKYKLKEKGLGRELTR